jgi:hypothetical protein
VNPILLEELEEGELQQLPPAVQTFINRKSEGGQGHRLDREVRRWLAIRMPDIFQDVDKKIIPKAVGKRFKEFLAVSDYTEANVNNNFWLRFIDYSPHFLFRDIRTQLGFTYYFNVSEKLLPRHLFLILSQEVKHSISNFKTHILDFLRAQKPALYQGRFGTAMTPKEYQAAMRALNGVQRDTGFQLFSTSEEVHSSLSTLLEARAEELRLAKKKEETILVAHHAVKVALWKELGDEERKRWRQEAKEKNAGQTKPRLSEDR